MKRPLFAAILFSSLGLISSQAQGQSQRAAPQAER